MKRAFDNELISGISKLFEIVLEIYDEVDGEVGEDRPEVMCPACKKETKNYACAWDYNKHVHFYCDHCDLSIMQ